MTISQELRRAAELVAAGYLFDPEWLSKPAWAWWRRRLRRVCGYGAWLYERNIFDHHLDLYSAAMVAEAEGL